MKTVLKIKRYAQRLTQGHMGDRGSWCWAPERSHYSIIKFPSNARCDWLKQRALSEDRARVDDSKLAFKFCFGILTNLTQIKHPLCMTQTSAM